MMGSNRQLLALAICFYSLKFVFEKKPVQFFSLVFFASFFHSSALFFIVYYFLNRKINPVAFVSIIIGAFILGKTELPLILFSKFGNLIGGDVLDKTTAYSDSAKEALTESSLSTIGLIKRLVFLLFFYLNRNKLSNKLSYYNVLLNGYYVGIVLYFFFANTLLIMINRGSLYFVSMEALLLAAQTNLLKDKATKLLGITILLIFAIFFFFQSISAYPDLFIPYKGVFINSDFQRTMY
jgi:hypothetical protein